MIEGSGSSTWVPQNGICSIVITQPDNKTDSIDSRLIAWKRLFFKLVIAYNIPTMLYAHLGTHPDVMALRSRSKRLLDQWQLPRRPCVPAIVGREEMDVYWSHNLVVSCLVRMISYYSNYNITCTLLHMLHKWFSCMVHNASSTWAEKPEAKVGGKDLAKESMSQ